MEIHTVTKLKTGGTKIFKHELSGWEIVGSSEIMWHPEWRQTPICAVIRCQRHSCSARDGIGFVSHLDAKQYHIEVRTVPRQFVLNSKFSICHCCKNVRSKNCEETIVLSPTVPERVADEKWTVQNWYSPSALWAGAWEQRTLEDATRQLAEIQSRLKTAMF